MNASLYILAGLIIGIALCLVVVRLSYKHKARALMRMYEQTSRTQMANVEFVDGLQREAAKEFGPTSISEHIAETERRENVAALESAESRRLNAEIATLEASRRITPYVRKLRHPT